MRYFVLGYDGHHLFTLTRQEFRSKELALAYAKTCDKNWRPFVVQEVA